jgi:signal transduction histidine kinase
MQKIANQNSDLETLQQRLLEVSRIAAMSEMTTGVLHNVGNVLNSVNVSITLLGDNLKKSRYSDVSRIAELLRSHQIDLASFLTTDPKGQRIVEFLAQLGERLVSEQAIQAMELESLQKNLAHIKEIVSIQQNCANISGVTEIIQISELVEDTIRLNAASLSRHDVEVVRDFDHVPPITIDKHKVLQILANLIRNAQSACEDGATAHKQVTVTVRNESDRVKISVADNGIGIPPQNLNRIFGHGFTTKKDGHGFGLHSGSLAACELGGRLTAYSEGCGRGAVFTLELPLQPSYSK